MKVLVVGAKGMLGSDLVAACKKAGHSTKGYDVDELDIRDYKDVREKMPSADCVINCAAYTHVDGAEAERDAAYAVNAEGARNLALVCVKKKCRLVQVSTDYVFDGTRTRPYAERDHTCPINIYGASKLAGEKAVRAVGGHFLVVRTQSLFGQHGNNFVKAIVKKLKESDDPLSVVDDQRSSPTYTPHLAEAIVRLIEVKAEGVVHVSASRDCSWFEFARAIADRVKPDAVVNPISAAALNQPAQRPEYSVFDTRRYRILTGDIMPTWEQGLDEFLAKEGVEVA